jgi:plasmid stabilization system protein ParE
MQFPAVSREIRRALLQTFPYAVYFRVTDDAVIILAVLHLRRDPRTWRDRP